MNWQRIKCLILGHQWVVKPENWTQGVAAERNCACGAYVPAVVWPKETDKQQTIWSPTGPRNGRCPPAPPMPPVPASAAAKPWNDIATQPHMMDCARFSVSPGDTVVITSRDRLTREQRDRFMASTALRLPDGVKVLVLDAGMTLSVVGKSA